MPKTGPSDGWRMRAAARSPMRFRPWARPTVVVVLPSPSGVGRDRRDDDVLAVRAARVRGGRRPARATLALVEPYSSISSSCSPSVPRDLRDRLGLDGAGDLQVEAMLRATSDEGWSAPRRVRPWAGRPLGPRSWRRAARIRWARSSALVTGPTPPGTGVMAEATRSAESKSTSPTSRPSTTLMPTSTTTAPRRSMSPVRGPGDRPPTTTISAPRDGGGGPSSCCGTR